MLALVILAASMFLRLTTIFGSDGQTISTLPALVENSARIAHRLAASGVGLLSVCLVVLVWARRSMTARFAKPIAWIVLATVVLAVIGPLTPGYRVTAVTVGNVAGGVVLLLAFWWLRESSAIDPSAGATADPLLRYAILVLLAQVATGAAASAQEMHGVRWFVYVHLGAAILTTMFIGASLWVRRAMPALAPYTAAGTGLLLVQLVLGIALLWLGDRPIWLALIHGMLSPLMGMALVSIATRDSGLSTVARESVRQ
jgi:heme A synthase